MSYRLLVRPLLFSMEPEAAHAAAGRALELAGRSAAARGILRKLFGAPGRPRKVAGLDFPNPVGLAAGFDKDCRLAEVLPCLGFGFIELGTITWEPQEGNARPRLFRLEAERGLLNRLGFNNPGALEAARRLGSLKSRSVPLGLNIGKSANAALDDAPADYLKSLEALSPHGDYFVLNISSPNTDGLRRLHERPRLEALLSAAKGLLERRASKKPLFVKLSPDLDEARLEQAAELCAAYGAGIVSSNTSVSRDGLEARWREQAGGMSGAPLKEAALGQLRRLKALTAGKVPLIGVGGILSPEDANERFAAGADLIQIYTGWIYEGPGLVRRIVEAISDGPPLPPRGA